MNPASKVLKLQLSLLETENANRELYDNVAALRPTSPLQTHHGITLDKVQKIEEASPLSQPCTLN